MKLSSEYAHGGEVYDKEIVLDYSINVNPFGMPDSVKQAIQENINEYMKYPDDSCMALRKSISEANKKNDVTPNMILCGNGAADLIYRLCLAVRPKKAMVLAPTFSEYEQALKVAGSEVIYYSLKEENGFEVQEDFLVALEESACKMVFLCNPNNPIGNIIPYERMEKIITKCNELGIILAVDECFMEFTRFQETHSIVSKLRAYQNLIVIKAFTKTYAMAGIRLGYVLSGNLPLLEKMKRSGPPWPVSTIAQVTGVAAIKETEYVDKARAYIESEREYLSKELKRIGCKVYPSQTNYLVFEDPSHGQSEKNLYERMLEQKILIRQCGNYHGLGPNYYRITVGVKNDNKAIIKALQNEIVNYKNK